MSTWKRRRLLSVLACVLVVTASVAPGLAYAPASDDAVGSERLRTAIDDGRGHLLDAPSRQGDHWSANVSVGENATVDVRLTVYYALTLERLDADPDRKRRAIGYLLDARDPDGGWSDPAANYGGLLLLREVDAERYSEEIADVAAELDRQNASLTAPVGSRGVSGMFRVKLFYALMSDRYSTAELFPRNSHRRLPGLLGLTPAFEGEFDPNESAVNPYAVDWLLSASLLGASVEENATTNDTEQATDLLLARRLTDGTWKGSLDNTFAALALHEVGYDADDPEVERALDWLGDHRLTDEGRLVAYKLPVWDTAWAMRALNASGVPASNRTMERAGQWLVDARTTDLRATPQNLTLMRPPVTFRQHWGNGWGYRPQMYSDWDDTAVAVTALSPYGETLVADDVRFLTSVQNEEGSWSAFVTDFSPLTTEERRLVERTVGTGTYRSLFADHPAPGVTGHALEALGEQGYAVETNESVRRAVSYLLDHRASNGMWMGVWGEGYTYGTSRVLLGLNATGVDTSRPRVQAAVRALAAKQNPDGGWGERSAYRVASENATPPYRTADSTVAQTAWAVQALLAGGVSPDNETVRRGVRFLLDAQREDGSWPSSRVMANLGPPLYESPVVTQASALRALSAYADAKGVPTAPDDRGTGIPAWLTDEWLLAGVAAVVLTGSVEYGSRRW